MHHWQSHPRQRMRRLHTSSDERSQRMVAEAMSEDRSLSLTAAVKRVGPRVGVNADTLPGWIRRSDIDAGRAPGVTTADAATVKALQAEVRELKRANEMERSVSCGAVCRIHPA